MASCSTASQETAPVYGFLCEETNVFYAFETFEQYQEFLGWLQRTPLPEPRCASDEMMSEEELRWNFDRATENIMAVFRDPVFSAAGAKMELEEVDF
jgi:hypothetical protein